MPSLAKAVARATIEKAMNESIVTPKKGEGERDHTDSIIEFSAIK